MNLNTAPFVDEERADEITASMKKTIARIIQRKLKTGRISQSELARQLRTSRSTVNRMLKRPGSTTLLWLSRVFVTLGIDVRFKLTNP